MVSGSSKTFTFTVQNTGDLGADAYDLSVATGWPATLYTADGSTALTDTNSNGVIDTGAIAPNATQTYTVRIAAPANLGAGQWNAATMTVRSTRTPAIAQNIKIQTALPAPIALAFTTGGSAQMNTLLASAGDQRVITQTISETLSLVSAIVRRPNGGFVQTITTRTCDNIGGCDFLSYSWRLYVAFIDKTGQVEKIITTTTEIAVSPSIAIAPNGNILLAWTNNLGSTDPFIFQDVAYMVLDPQGTILKPSTSLAGLADPFSNGYAGSTNVAATGDGNFVVSWFRAYDAADNNLQCKRDSFNRPCALIDIYYAVFDSTGAVVKAADRLTADTPNKLDSYSTAALATQGSNHVVFSLVRTDAQTQTLQLGQMDSMGHVTISPTLITTRTNPIGWMDTPKLIELSTGRILLGWFQRNDGSAPTLQILSFDAALGTKLGPTVIPNPEEDGANPCCISFAADRFGYASMVWTNSFDSYSQRSFYMLIDQTGQIIIPRITHFNTVKSLIFLPGNFKNINTNGFALASASADAAIQIFVPMSLR